ncbi:MAG: copper amine oxidase N-terminal domain-containing protein [Oscillospiraceae bacterium]|nr:copper amine oxidase N-terminal domain-containing protein [Oscillospiraceae bacterium]
MAIVVVCVFASPGTAGVVAVAAGELGVKEAPHVRVVVNGVPGTYTDAALELNARILLPFREVLTKLGVPNDDEHIKWNDDDESVTVLYGQDEIWLQIGNPVMTLNGVEKPFDVAPFFNEKNNRSYVPVRAVSELLDKYVMWEDATSTVYIRDKANYAETLSLLERMNKADKPAMVRASTDSLINFQITTSGAPLADADEDGVLRASMETSKLIMSDRDSGITHIKQLTVIDGINIGSELFVHSGRNFMKIEGPGLVWSETFDQYEDIDATLARIMMSDALAEERPPSDIAMGLAVTMGPEDGYTIVGEPLAVADINAVLETVSGMMSQENAKDINVKLDKFQIGTTIDSDYNPVKAVATLSMLLTYTEKTAGGNYVSVYFGIDMYMTMLYDRVEPDFEIPIPDGVASLL